MSNHLLELCSVLFCFSLVFKFFACNLFYTKLIFSIRNNFITFYCNLIGNFSNLMIFFKNQFFLWLFLPEILSILIYFITKFISKMDSNFKITSSIRWSWKKGLSECDNWLEWGSFICQLSSQKRKVTSPFFFTF